MAMFSTTTDTLSTVSVSYFLSLSRPQSTTIYTQYVMDTNKMSLKLNTHRSLWNALGNP